MTIRDNLTRKVHLIRLIALGGFALAVNAMIYSQSHPGAWPFVVFGGAAFLLTIARATYGVACPACGGKITRIYPSLTAPFCRYESCPCCGESLDTELSDIRRV